MRSALTPSPVAAEADLSATVNRLFTALRRFNPPGISLTAAATLSTLDREGPRRLTELAAIEGVTQPAMTQIVSRLERDALATRIAEPADRRVVLVGITQAGRDLLRHRRRVRSDQVGVLLARLTPEQRAVIEAALPALDALADLAATTEKTIS